MSDVDLSPLSMRVTKTAEQAWPNCFHNPYKLRVIGIIHHIQSPLYVGATPPGGGVVHIDRGPRCGDPSPIKHLWRRYSIKVYGGRNPCALSHHHMDTHSACVPITPVTVVHIDVEKSMQSEF